MFIIEDHEKLSTTYPHPSFRTYLFHMIVPIYGHISIVAGVFMENVADKMLVSEHFSLMRQ